MTTSAHSQVERQVVVGIDGSSSSLAALDWGARQADVTAAALMVVAAWHWPGACGPRLMGWYGYAPEADAQGVLDDSLSETRQRRPTLRLTAQPLEGDPAAILVD